MKQSQQTSTRPHGPAGHGGVAPHHVLLVPAWLTRSWPHPILSYVGAILLSGMVVAITFLLVRFFPTFSYPGTLSIVGIVVIALRWGAGPSLLATLLIALLLDMVILPPQLAWRLHTTQQMVDTAVFVLIGLSISVVASRIAQARTQALQAQREATARAEQMEAVFEAMADGVSLYERSGRLVRMNQAAHEFFAATAQPDYPSLPSEQQASLLSLRDEQGRVLPKEQWPLTRTLQGEVLKGPQALDIRATDPSGHEFEFSISGAPIHDQHGGIRGAVLLTHDVTERRRLERRTRESLTALLAMAEVLVQHPAEDDAPPREPSRNVEQAVSHLATLTQHVLGCEHVSIIQVEPDSQQLRPLACVGYLPEEEQHWLKQLARLRLSDYLTPDLLARLAIGETVLIEEAELLKQRPIEHQHTSILVAPLRAGSHLIGLLVLECGDCMQTCQVEEQDLVRAIARLASLVLEREQLVQERAEARANELAAREARQRMNTFLGIASHELRTPLTIIKGNLQLATWSAQHLISQQNERLDEAEHALDPLPVLLGHVQQQVNRLSRLVNDLIEASRIQTETLELHMEVCNLGTLIREVVEDQRMIAPTRTIHLELDSSDDALIYADVDRIRQVVTNYLTNALKYSADDQPIEVRIEQGEQVVRVLVHDRGPGLTADQQAEVWERFHRVEGMKVQNGSSEGLGLGLYISRMIIERHGGQVGVDSRPGEGSTFWFSLPRLQREEETMGDHNADLE